MSKVYIVIRRLDWPDGGDTILSVWSSKRKAESALNVILSERNYYETEMVIEDWAVS